jgi:drug/metabolite transporter (DMT)-like permease
VTPRRADAELLAATAVWGVSFVVLKGALAAGTPLAFVALRFGLGALVLAPFVPGPWRFSPAELRAGAALAALMTGGFATQMVGLAHTTPSRSAFLVATSSVLAPVFAVLLVRERPRRAVVAALALATAGIWLLTAPQAGGLNRGDAWTLVTAVCFGGQIVAVSHLGPRHDPRRLVWLQIAGIALGGTLAAAALEPVRVAWTPAFLAALAYAAVAATALALVLQMRAQRVMSATRAAVLFCTEPVFAAGASWLWLREVLSASQWLGAGLILAAMVVVELPAGRRAPGSLFAGRG